MKTREMDIALRSIGLFVCGFLALLLSACGGGGSGGSVSATASADVGTGTEPTVSTDLSHVAVTNTTDSGLDPLWYKKGAFMQVFIRAYNDSNGDGVGDINGVTQKLDYLKSLGITGIWLMSPVKNSDHDHGYFIVDYRSLDAEYGVLTDLQTLIQEAHKRGIGILVDYVMESSSIQHPLFTDSSWGTNAKYRNWYLWSETQPSSDWTTGNIITYADPWIKHGTNSWYYGLFASNPFFNLTNPDVITYHQDNIRFWLNLGVDGFRFDAVGTYVENGPYGQGYQLQNLAIVRAARQIINQYPKRYMVCEAPGWENVIASESGCKSAFAFQFDFAMQRYFVQQDTTALDTIANYPLNNEAGKLAPMLNNHDHFAGLRPMTELNGDEAAYRLEAATYLTFPGSPFLYYGEEIGMADQSGFDAQSDWPLGGPMSWGQAPTVTITTNTGAVPNYFKPAPNIATHNVATELADPNSLLKFYTTLLNARQNHEALSLGTYKLVKQTSNGFVFLRTSTTESVLVALNYGTVATSVPMQLEANTTYTPLLAYNVTTGNLVTNAQGTFAQSGLAMPAQSVQVFSAPRVDAGPYLSAAAAPTPADMYIVGDLTNWGISPGSKLSYQGNGIYSVSLAVSKAGTYNVHVSDSGPGLNVFGIVTEPVGSAKVITAANGASVELEQTSWHKGNTSNYQGVGDDVQFVAAQAGNYTFVLDAHDTLNPSLTITLQ